jgi:hypothetical protein
MDYFVTVHGGFGPLSWLSMLGWVFALAGGMYLYRSWQERNPVRSRFIRQLGQGLSVLGAVGLVLLALKATGLDVVGWPLWSYLWGLATLLFAGWAAWYYFARLPRLLAATRPGARGAPVTRTGQTARTYSSSPPRAVSAPPAAPPRPESTTGRREARRDKKRRSR